MQIFSKIPFSSRDSSEDFSYAVSGKKTGEGSLSHYVSKNEEYSDRDSFYAGLQDRGVVTTSNDPSLLQDKFSQVLALKKDLISTSPCDHSSLERETSALEEACFLGKIEKVQEILLSAKPSIETVIVAIKNARDVSFQRKLLERLSSTPSLHAYFTGIQTRDPLWMHSLVVSGIREIEQGNERFLEKNLNVRKLFQTFCTSPFFSSKDPILYIGETQRTQDEFEKIDPSAFLSNYLKNSKILTEEGLLASRPTLLETRNHLEYALQHLAVCSKRTCEEIEHLGYQLWYQTLSEAEQKEEDFIAKLQEGSPQPVTYDLILWDKACSHLKMKMPTTCDLQETFLQKEVDQLLVKDPLFGEKIRDLYRNFVGKQISPHSSNFDVYFAYMQQLKSLYDEVSYHIDHPLFAIAVEEAYAARDFSFLLFVQKELLEYRIPGKKLWKGQTLSPLSVAYQKLEGMICAGQKWGKIQSFFSKNCLEDTLFTDLSYREFLETSQKFFRETDFSFLKDFFVKQGVLHKGQLLKGSSLAMKIEKIRLNKDLFFYLVQQEAQKMKIAIPDQIWSLSAIDELAKKVVYKKFAKMLTIYPVATLKTELEEIIKREISEEHKLIEFTNLLRGPCPDPHFEKLRNYLRNPFPCPEKLEKNPWQAALIGDPLLGESLLKFGCRWKLDRPFQENFRELFSTLYFMVEGIKGTIRSVHPPEQSVRILKKLSEAMDKYCFSEIAQIFRELSLQGQEVIVKNGFSLVAVPGDVEKRLNFSSKIFETLSWFIELGLQDSLDLPTDVWSFAFPYHEKAAHLKMAFQAFYKYCCEEIRSLSMHDIYIELLDTAISENDTAALTWIYHKISHERYRQELYKMQQQGEPVEELMNLEKAWEEAPLDEKISEIKIHLYKTSPSSIRERLLLALSGVSAERSQSQEALIRKRGQEYFKKQGPNKPFQAYLQAHSFSPSSWDKKEIDQFHTLYQQFLLQEKRSLLLTNPLSPFMDPIWNVYLRNSLKEIDLESKPLDYRQLLIHLQEEWQTYLLKQLDLTDFFDLEALDQIVSLAKCKDRLRAMKLCSKLQQVKHAAYLVTQFPASKIDWKSLLKHILPASLHKEFFKELFQTREGKSYFFRLAKVCNQEKDSRLWDFLEEVVETASCENRENRDEAFLPLNESEVLPFFFDYYLQSAKSAETFFANERQDEGYFRTMQLWLKNDGKNSLLKKFLDKYCHPLPFYASNPPVSYKLHVLRICIPFLKDICGKYDGTNDFIKINDLITEVLFDRYVQSFPLESPMRIAGDQLLVVYHSDQISTKEMQKQASTLIESHTGMSLVDALEPFLSFSETDLKGVFPWKPLKYPNSLLGKYLQKDGVQASSFQNFLQTYLDAHQLIGSVLSIFQERYSFIKKIIDDKNSGIKKDYYQSLLESLANRLVEFTKTKDMDLLCKMMDDLVALEFQSITDSMHPNKGLEELKSFVRGHVRYSETKKTDFLKLLEGELLFVSWQNKIEAFKQWLEDPLFSNFHFFHSEEGLSLYDLRQKMGTIRFIVNAWVKKALHDLGLPALYGRLFDYANCNEQDHFSTWMVRKILYTRYERALTDFPEKDEDLETLREEVKSLPLQERIQKTKDLLESKDQPRYRQLMEVLTQVDWDINLV